MLPVALPLAGGPEAVSGVHRYIQDDRGRLSLESSLYDMARATLDRLISRGAFSVDDYEGVRDVLVYANVPPRLFSGAREDLLTRLDAATFHLTVDVDPETGARQIVVVAQAAVSPQEAARVAWDFYGEWLAQQPPAYTATVTFDVRSDIAP